MATSRVLLKTTEYVQINSTHGHMVVEALSGDVHIAVSQTKPAVGNSAFHKLTDRQRLPILDLETGENVWALGKNSTSRAVVTETDTTGHDDYRLEVARGNIPGARGFYGFGQLVTSGAVTNQVVWPNGVWSAPPSAGTQMAVVSDSANDTDTTGTGARKIRLIYLDDNLIEHFEDVSLNGTTPVLTTATNIRFVQCAFVFDYGSNMAADGNISITSPLGTTVYGYISADGLRCSSSVRMVPSGKRAVIEEIIGSSTSGTAAAATNVRIAVSKFEGFDFIDDSILIPLGNLGFQDNSFGLTFKNPIIADEGTAIGLIATSDKAATISGSWYGYYENV